MSAVAAMSPKPMTASSVRSSNPPATTSSACRGGILSIPPRLTPPRWRTPHRVGSSSRSCRRDWITCGNDVGQDLLQDVVRLGHPSRLPWYIVCIDVMPPMPVPGCWPPGLGAPSASTSGVNPRTGNASTVATMFHSATRSMEPASVWGDALTVGSKPVGICAPTVRDSLVLWGRGISLLRLADHLPVSSVSRQVADHLGGHGSKVARAKQ